MHIYGIGTDIVECERIGRMIERHGEHFIHRVYTDQEIAYCNQHRVATLHFAGRWAAKEAVLKALGTGWVKGISWRDVEVRNVAGGRPIILLSGGAKERCDQAGITEMKISISHCQSHATAYAVAVGEA